MIVYLKTAYKSQLEKWCQAQKHKNHLWTPWLSILLTVLIYGALEAVYTSYASQHHFHVSYPFTIICLAITALVVSIIFEFALYAQRHFIHPKFITSAKWISHSIINILVAWLLPAIIYVFFITTFSVKAKIGANQAEIDRMMKANSSVKLYVIIMAVIIAPVIEEFIFRFLLIGPKKFAGKKYNQLLRTSMIIISLILFAYEHVAPQLNFTDWHSSGSILVVVALSIRFLVLGSVLTYIYTATNDIRASIIAHMGANLISLLLI